MVSTLKLRFLGLAFVLMSFVALDALKAQGNSANGCPQRPSRGICIQVIAYGQNPGNGRCCQFPTPCAVPPGWEVFFSLEACEAAG